MGQRSIQNFKVEDYLEPNDHGLGCPGLGCVVCSDIAISREKKKLEAPYSRKRLREIHQNSF